jgi:hypothetical protein
MKFAIHADLLMDLQFAVSTEETRYYLQGVYVDEKGMLAATDGHVLGVICPQYGKFSHDFFSALAGQIVRLPPPKETRTRRGTQAWIVIEAKTGALHVSQTGLDKSPEDAIAAVPSYIMPGTAFIDGTFPDWRRVLPPIGAGALKQLTAISTTVLSNVIGLFDRGPFSAAFLQFFQHDADDPVIVRSGLHEDRFMVAMPGRGNIKTNAAA